MKRQAIPPPTIGACQKQPRIHLYSLGNTTKKIEINKNTSITISIHTYRQPSVFICWHVLGMWEEARVSAEKATSERYEGSSWEPKPRLARKGTMLPIQQKKKQKTIRFQQYQLAFRTCRTVCSKPPQNNDEECNASHGGETTTATIPTKRWVTNNNSSTSNKNTSNPPWGLIKKRVQGPLPAYLLNKPSTKRD